MKYTIAIVLIVLVQIWLVIPIWNPGFKARTVPVILVLGLAAWRQFRKRSHWGLSPKALVPASIRAAVFTLPVVLFAVLYLVLGSSTTPKWASVNLPVTFGFLFIWALGQQFALQAVILEESIEKLKEGRKAVLLTAGIFALLHLPNPFLTAVTFVGGVVWCSIYRRYPNIVPLALSHAISSLSLMAALDREITGGMRVGYSYLVH